MLVRTTVPTLYVMCGLPFAGKSTIATALVEALGAEVVRLETINHERGLGLGGRAISPEDWAISYAEADRRLERALAGGWSVIADATHFGRAERDRARALAQAQGARTRVVYVPVTAEVARRRLLANRQMLARATTCGTRISPWWSLTSSRPTASPTWCAASPTRRPQTGSRPFVAICGDCSRPRASSALRGRAG